MPLDGDGIIRAASQLDVAVQLGSAARTVDVPLAIGRGAAKERVASLLTETNDWARGASAELEGAPEGLMDIRRGIDQLVAASEAAAGASKPWKARSDSGYVDAVEGARATRERMSELVTGAESVDSGSTRDWLLQATSPDTTAARVQAATDLARLGELDSIGAARGFVERMDPTSKRSIELARIAVDDGPTRAGELLLADLRATAGGNAGVFGSDLRLALETAGHADAAPTWLTAELGSIKLDDVHGAGLDLAARGTAPDGMPGLVRELLARPLAELGRGERAVIAALPDLPSSRASHLDPELLDSARGLADELRSGSGGGDEAILEMWRREAIAQAGGPEAAFDAVLVERSGTDGLRRARAIGLDVVGDGFPLWTRDVGGELVYITDDVGSDVALDAFRTMRRGITAEAAADRATELARMPGLDQSGARELASLSLLPTHIRPTLIGEHGPDLMRAARGESVDVLEDLRWSADRQWVDANPTEGRAFIDQEIRRIAGLPDDQVGAPEIARLGRITELAPELRPIMPAPKSYSFSDLAAYRYGRTYEKPELEHLRTSIARADLELDPAITAETLHDEVRAILAKPNAEVTADDIHRLALVEGIDGAKSVGLPDPRSYSFSTIREYGWVPSESYVGTELEHLRTWLARGDIERDPAMTAELLHDEVRAILAKPDADISLEDIGRIGLLDGLDGAKSLNLPEPRNYAFSTLRENAWAGTQSYAATELGHLRSWLQRTDIERDASITAATLLDEVRAVLAKPNAEISTDELRRIALLEGVTGGKSVGLPDPRSYNFTTIREYGWGSGDAYVTTELEHLRTWLARGDIERDASITAGTLHDEVRAILAKPNADITTDELRRIALLEGVGGAKSLGLPDPRIYNFATIRDYGWSSTESYTATELNHLRTWLARGDIERDASITAQQLHAEVRAILAKPNAEVTADELTRIGLLEGVTGPKALGLPDPRSYSFSRIREYGWSSTESHTATELEHLRTWLQRSDIVNDPTITAQTLREEVRAILAKPNAEVTGVDVRRIALIEGIEGPKSLGLPTPKSYSFSTIRDYGWSPSESYAVSELEHLRHWLQRGDIAADPATTAATLQDEVRAILAKPNAEITPDELRRIALLEGIEGAKSVGLPSARSYNFSTIRDYGWTSGESYVTTELDHLRRWVQRVDIDRDASITAEALQDEVRAIVSKPDPEITPDDIRRIALIEGVEGAKSAGLPTARSYNFSTIGEYGWSSSESYVTTELNQLRSWMQRIDIERDPTITVEALRKEAAQIALLPTTELTNEQLRRLHVLSTLEGQRALDLPVTSGYSYQQLADYGTGYAESSLAPLREWALVNTPDGLDQVAAQLRNGQTVSPATLAMLGSRQAELAERGVDTALVLDSGIASLRAKTGSYDQTAELTLVQGFIRGLEPPAQLRELQVETLELARRNLDRMAGRLSDGYSTYPELAEMGRIIENAELLGRATAAAKAPVPAFAAVTTDAAAGAAHAGGHATSDAVRVAGDQLTW